MKRGVFFIIIFFFLYFFNLWQSSYILAQDTGCQTTTLTECTLLTCNPPCRKTLKQPGARNVPGHCTCEFPPPEGSVLENGICEEDIDCVLAAPFCWNDTPHQLKTCHKNPPPSPPPKASSSPVVLEPIFCDIGYEPTTGEFSYGGIKTALGCIPTDPQKLLEKFLPYLMGLAGGIAFLMMLLAAFEILTSAGNPEKVKHGKERLTSAIIGLLFVIFSTFILRIIGLPIMNISK